MSNKVYDQQLLFYLLLLTEYIKYEDPPISVVLPEVSPSYTFLIQFKLMLYSF